jgi:crotonobetainyl-CoA:carnitine CoA-transferase CaiB-like acyl-CoA transferase
MGNAHPSIAPYELFETGDGQLVIAVGTDRQFGDLCEALGARDLAVEERFATNTQRVAHRLELRAALEERLAARSAHAWADLLTAARVPAGVVNDLAAAFDLASRLGLTPIIPVPDDDGSEVALTRNPIALSETPPEYRRAPPALAEPDEPLTWRAR